MGISEVCDRLVDHVMTGVVKLDDLAEVDDWEDLAH